MWAQSSDENCTPDRQQMNGPSEVRQDAVVKVGGFGGKESVINVLWLASGSIKSLGRCGEQ